MLDGGRGVLDRALEDQGEEGGDEELSGARVVAPGRAVRFDELSTLMTIGRSVASQLTPRQGNVVELPVTRGAVPEQGLDLASPLLRRPGTRVPT